jgi:hypothetical protein
MTLQTILGGGTWLWTPQCFTSAGAAFGGGMIMDASAEKVALIGEVPKTGTLDKFEWRLGTVTQAPANGLRCSFQDVSATDGAPDGTQDQYRDVTSGITSNSWVAPGLMTSDGTDGGVKRSVTQGDIIACVVEFVSFSASDNVRVAQLDTDIHRVVGQFPYSNHFTAAWAVGSPTSIMVLKYNDGTYASFHPTILPVLTFNNHTMNTGTTPDEIALLFQVPFSCKIGGAGFRVDADQDFDIILYDSDGTTPLATSSRDKDRRGSTAGINGFARFTSDVTLTINTDYRLAVKPTTASSIVLYSMDVSAAAILGAIEGGTSMSYSSRSDAGAWTPLTTRRPLIYPWLTALDDGAGGGGSNTGIFQGINGQTGIGAF